MNEKVEFLTSKTLSLMEDINGKQDEGDMGWSAGPPWPSWKHREGHSIGWSTVRLPRGDDVASYAEIKRKYK